MRPLKAGCLSSSRPRHAVEDTLAADEELRDIVRSLRDSGGRTGSPYFRGGRNVNVPKRSYGTGHLYEKHGAYYARWRTGDGRQLNRRLGPVRRQGTSSGLSRSQAERLFRKLQQEEERRPAAPRDAPATMSDAADALRLKLRLEGARPSYLAGCLSMQRVHIDPRLGSRRVAKVTTADVEALASAMLTAGLKPKSVHNVLVFLNGVFEHAIERGWVHENPVRRAARPANRRDRGGDPDLRFLTLGELEAVLRALPDGPVQRTPAPTRRGPARPRPAGTSRCVGPRA